MKWQGPRESEDKGKGVQRRVILSVGAGERN
jgi:hypothetical protein